MKTLTEGQLTFTFSDSWEVNKYDESHFFRNHIDKCQGSKAVDILALSAQRVCSRRFIAQRKGPFTRLPVCPFVRL